VAVVGVNMHLAEAASITDCYTCSKVFNGVNKMCSVTTATDDPFAVVCCEPDDTDTRCSGSEGSQCTSTYS
jgi:hypothetical protein